MARPTSNGIDVQRLDQQILDLGVRVKVYRSTVCPNLTSLESADHDVNCNHCNNMMIDFDCRETVALFQQQNLAEQFKIQGTFHLDEVMVTFLSGVSLSTYTRVDLLDFTEDFFQLVQRHKDSDIDVLKYKATEVLGLFTSTGGDLKEYHYGTDFCLDVNGSIKWMSEHRPAPKQIYTIYYKYAPIYRAIKAVHRDRYSQANGRNAKNHEHRVEHGGRVYVKLPETWILKRDYLINRKDDNGTRLPETPLYNPNE